jgi:exodeoxyribonuclease-3
MPIRPPFHIVSWNVNGLRAVWKKGFCDWLSATAPDFCGLQETKIAEDQLSDELRHPCGYQGFASCAEKRGYSGVLALCRHAPQDVCTKFGVERFDTEGRIVCCRYGKLLVFNVYFPNGKSSPERLAYKLEFYDWFLNILLQKREEGFSVVCIGDVNTAHTRIDLARPDDNEDVSGFLPIERAWLDKLFTAGFLDSFRVLFPEKEEVYTWWSQRSGARQRNVGWRIDYGIISEDLRPYLISADVHSEVLGSDHCPISLRLDLPERLFG